MLIEKLLSTDKKIKDMPNNPRPDYEPSWGYRTESGERVSVEASKAIATAYRAKNIISDDVGKMPFQEFRRENGKIEQIEPDPVTRNNAYLLQISPNLWDWTPFQFKKSIIEWQLFYGNAYIWAPIVGPRQFLILPADKTVPVFDLDGNLWYQHTFSNSNVPQYIPAVEILHLLINPDSTGFVGRGVITYARETFGRRIAGGKTKSMFYKQGYLPAAYVQMEGELNAEARKKVRGAYEEQMSGSENAYRLAVFDKKITKFEAINMQLKDAQFVESIDADDRDICNFFGLSEHMLNRGKEAYNSNEQKYIEYLQGTLNSYLVPMEQGARIKWLSRNQQITNYFKFIREALLQMDAKTRSEVEEKQIQNGILTPNEALEKEDRNGYPEGNRHYMMSNVMAIENTPSQSSPITPHPTLSPEGERDEEKGGEDALSE
ncbi:MAG: phage portal protein [Chloroflexi bacterium RBG_16_54_11]|nr:MAG: phage portal protein [Chloroflexi bacterium RBG_16_54_11]